jgi:ABC-type transport system substrate-binding protein
VDSLASDQNIEIITSLDTNSVIGLSWCKSEPPLDDVRVRKALALASDKETMNTLLFNGEGEVAWGMSQEGHPFYDPTQVGVNAYDPEEAKRLLAEAGYPDGFQIGMFFQSAGDPQRAAEILQQQWAEVGVQVTLEPVANLLTDYYQEVKNPILLLNDTGVNNIVRQYGTPESIANVCQYADPAFVDPLNKLSELAYGSPEWIEQLHVVEDLLNEHMVNEAMVFPPRSVAFNSRVGGVRVIGNYTGNPIIDLFDTYIIAS